MKNSELIAKLQELPPDIEVEIEVLDIREQIRLFGQLILVNVEGDEVNLFAHQYYDDEREEA